MSNVNRFHYSVWLSSRSKSRSKLLTIAPIKTCLTLMPQLYQLYQLYCIRDIIIIAWLYKDDTKSTKNENETESQIESDKIRVLILLGTLILHNSPWNWRISNLQCTLRSLYQIAISTIYQVIILCLPIIVIFQLSIIYNRWYID